MTSQSPGIEQAVGLALIRRFGADGTARALRLARRLTLADVGGAVGVAKSTVSKWERGLQMPTGEQAERYAALIGELVSLGDDG